MAASYIPTSPPRWSCQRSWSMLPCIPVASAPSSPKLQFFGKEFSGTCAGSHHKTRRGWGTKFRFVGSLLIKANRLESIPNEWAQMLSSKRISQVAVERTQLSPPRESLLPSLESAKPSRHDFYPYLKTTSEDQCFCCQTIPNGRDWVCLFVFFQISKGWAILNSPLALFPLVLHPIRKKKTNNPQNPQNILHIITALHVHARVTSADQPTLWLHTWRKWLLAKGRKSFTFIKNPILRGRSPHLDLRQ